MIRTINAEVVMDVTLFVLMKFNENLVIWVPKTYIFDDNGNPMQEHRFVRSKTGSWNIAAWWLDEKGL